MDREELRKYWQAKKAANVKTIESGKVRTAYIKGRYQVVCQNTDEWVNRAVNLDGRWRKRSQLWSFPIHRRKEVMDLIKECFGEESLTR